MNVVYNALHAYESSRIKSCKLALKTWDKLCEILESSQDIRKPKKSLLVVKYEFFKMEPNENVDKMYCKFSDIIKKYSLV